MTLFLGLTSAKAPLYVKEHCAAFNASIKVDDTRDKANKRCEEMNRACDAAPNWAAKGLCICTPEKYPDSRDQERCFEVAVHRIQKSESLKTSAVLVAKTPACAKLKKSASPGDEDAREEHVTCLKNALFDTDLAVQGQKNDQRWREHRADQKVERNMEYQENQRNNESVEDFDH